MPLSKLRNIVAALSLSMGMTIGGARARLAISSLRYASFSLKGNVLAVI